MSEMYADAERRYRLDSRIATGGMGVVWRATDTVLGRLVAVKVLKPEYADDALFRTRFETEAQHAAALHHPGVAQVFDYGEGPSDDGGGLRPFLVMELVEGQPLSALLRPGQPMPPEAARDLIARTADAIAAAHAKGIVHRDVKPANIMVDNTGRVKLTDFGVAYVPASTITGNGTALGSPRYMSPEQVTGAPIDPRSDIFSLGVVLYELLTKRTPFEHEGDTTVFALMNRIASTPHPPVRQVDPSVPEPFEHIVDRALAKKPDERYPRAGEMARELRDYRNVQPSSATLLAVAGDPGGGRSSGRVDAVRTQLINDLDNFVEQFDHEEQERIRAADAEQRKKEEQMRRWGEEQARSGGLAGQDGPGRAQASRVEASRVEAGGGEAGGAETRGAERRTRRGHAGCHALPRRHGAAAELGEAGGQAAL